MPYINRFNSTDNLIVHLGAFITTISDAAILASYAGFLSVSAVTVYELAIKDIFNEFAIKKNKVFGSFVENHFGRINGRISIDDLKNQHIVQFGEKYLKTFQKKLQEKEDSNWNTLHVSIKTMYKDLIQCRHNFVHKGSPTLTINEVINYYEYGKEVIHCLNDIMKR